MSNDSNCGSCELIDTCSFYWNYRDHPDVKRRNLTGNFCHTDLDSAACKRIAWFRIQSEYPPSDMTPEGDCVGGMLFSDLRIESEGSDPLLQASIRIAVDSTSGL